MVSGSNSFEVYNGEYLASQKVVFVCANYRVSLMGFLGSDLLQNEDEEGSTEKYCLMDLVFVLQWVKENIEQFGGDPENVIILGGSAGANLIDMLMISPKPGAIHDGHVPYFLHYLSHNFRYVLDESDFKMAKVASDYFINFCKYGNPNGNGLVKWEKSTGYRILRNRRYLSNERN